MEQTSEMPLSARYLARYLAISKPKMSHPDTYLAVLNYYLAVSKTT